MKTTIIYWTSTGNTEVMAQGILKGLEKETKLVHVAHAKAEDIKEADLVILGASAMGVEEIDDSEMAPFIMANKALFDQKKVALFGSYDWGDGEWMRTWEDLMTSLKAVLVTESFICPGLPDDETMVLLETYGQKLSGR